MSGSVVSRFARHTANVLALLRHGYGREFFQTLLQRMFADESYLGFGYDLSNSIPATAARIVVSVRPLAPGEPLPAVARTASESAADFHARLSRQRMVTARLPTPYVAVTEDGAICYVQWMVLPADFAALQDLTGGWYPAMQPDDALLEGAYTFEQFRGKGVAPAAAVQMSALAADRRAKRVVTFIGEDNIAARKGYERLGFVPYVRVRERWRFFRRALIFEPIGSSDTPL